METFDVTRLYTDEKGDSRFETIRYPLTDAGPIGYLSERYPVREIIFRKVPAGYDYTFHNAPQRQFIVMLDIGVEIETSTGEKRQFQPGEIILVEDTTGKGHRTRNLAPQVRSSLFITVA
ncbi:hypothetical protein JHJ32_00855 [Parapedobacter sp. ISTM3]|uniref:Cupin domain-containing protein n=1 Tax=Parapedobacter luteus TaxID=623280 RepID=A0A1T5D949_9SPHI|nr:MULTISPECIES: hypothetical protein [Parapedobacter]MBK1438522.1 hypothetical protein [Parapedobacter sp. ISTM3]SKB68189.1 hypothetical protein SAMN05660226_02622 [Parapedobacter luteus]